MAEYFVDPSVASATASTNSASPGNSFANAVAAATGANDIIRLAEGYVYAPDTANSYSKRIYAKAPANSLTVGSYTAASNPHPAMPPTLSAASWEPPSGATGWTHVSSGIWVKVYTATTANRSVFRLFVGAQLSGSAANASLGTGYSLGVPKRCAPLAYNASEASILAALNSTQIWAATTISNVSYGGASTGLLYVYTGSALIDPPTYYGGLMVLTAFDKTQNALEIRDSSNIIVQDLDAIGAGYASFYVYSTNTASGNNRVQNCNAYAFGWRGHRVAGASGFAMTGVQIVGGTVDAKAHPDEEWTTYAQTDWLFNLNEGLSASSYATGVRFSGVTVIDATHVAVSAGGTGAGTCDCSTLTVSAPKRHYGRVFAVVGAGGPFSLDRCRATQTTGWIEVLGYSTKTTVTNSIFEQGTQIFPAYVGSNNTPGSAGIRAIGMLASASSTTLVADSLIVDNCVLSNPQGPVLQLEQFTGGVDIPNNVVRFRNCLIEDNVYLSTRMLTDTVSAAGISMIVKVLAGKVIPAIDLTNSYLVRPSVGGNVLMESVGASATTSRTLAALSTATGCSEVTDKAALLVNSDWRPLPGSPLLGAGTYLSTVTRDFDLKQRRNPPAIGAFDLATLRTGT